MGENLTRRQFLRRAVMAAGGAVAAEAISALSLTGCTIKDPGVIALEKQATAVAGKTAVVAEIQTKAVKADPVVKQETALAQKATVDAAAKKAQKEADEQLAEAWENILKKEGLAVNQVAILHLTEPPNQVVVSNGLQLRTLPHPSAPKVEENGVYTRGKLVKLSTTIIMVQVPDEKGNSTPYFYGFPLDRNNVYACTQKDNEIYIEKMGK